MGLKVKHRETDKIHSMVYNHWRHEIVNKGKASEYIILDYPDLSQLIIINPYESIERSKILDTRFIKEQVDQHPNTYDLIKIDSREQISKDIIASNKINYQPPNYGNYKTMKIINIHTGKKGWINYEIWQTDFLQKHIAVNYKILTMPDLVDVFKIKPNGGHEYINTTDRQIATDEYLGKDKPYTIKKTDLIRFNKEQCRELTNPYTDKNANRLKESTISNSKTPHSLRRLFLKRFISKNPNKRLTKQSMQHITIVVLMILTLIVTIIIGWDNISDFINEIILKTPND